MLRRGGFMLAAALALLAVAAVATYLPSPHGAEEASPPPRRPAENLLAFFAAPSLRNGLPCVPAI